MPSARSRGSGRRHSRRASPPRSPACPSRSRSRAGAGPGLRSSRSSSVCDLAQLRVLEALALPANRAPSLGHRLVEPGRIEIVAEVVVGGDVLARLARRIVAQPMGERVDPAERALGAADIAERHRIGARTIRRSRPGRGSTIRRASTPCTSRPNRRSRGGPAPSSS